MPRVWLACLACYNDGRLIGQWVNCADVEDTTLADLHKGSRGPFAGCEEVWVFDHEFIPVSGEFGPLEAADWGKCYAEADADQWPAICAWAWSGMHVAEGQGEISVLSSSRTGSSVIGSPSANTRSS